MKDSIIVKVSDLRSAMQDIRRSGCDVVSLSILDSDVSDGETFPPCISLSACSSHDPSIWTDFEDVDAVPNEDELKKHSLNSVHMSSNL